MKIQYVPKKFRPATRRTIAIANQICDDYAAQGLNLTLRQLYYQFVAHHGLPNRQEEYTRLGSIINDARLAGLLDWELIVDRTRIVHEINHYNDPGEIIDTASRAYRTDKWATQPTRVEVWIEKDALIGVLEQACPAEDVAYFSCRGYTSQSAIWGAAQRVGEYIRAGQNVTIVHLGDHDPSGIDMTRDIEDRMNLFIDKDNARIFTKQGVDLSHVEGSILPALNYDEGGKVIRDEAYEEVLAWINARLAQCGRLRINRIALTMTQVDDYGPPPNPAKQTDSRAKGYIAEYGDDSWELDALDPVVLNGLIIDAIEEDRDEEAWDAAVAIEREGRELVATIARNWEAVQEFVQTMNQEGE